MEAKTILKASIYLEDTIMFLSHAYGILTHPDQEWSEIHQEVSGPTAFDAIFLALLASIGPVCAFISSTQFGWQIGNGAVTKLTIISALELSLFTYSAILCGVFGLGYLSDWMAKTYGGEPDEQSANGYILSSYACIPLFLAGGILIYPEPLLNMIVLLFAGLYSAYLFYRGLPIVMGINEERAFLFGISILTVGLIYLVATLVGTVLLWSFGYSPVFVSG
jgi:hypothetical protein